MAHKITLYPSEKSIECQAGDTVLMALERAGYALPNNCRAGACGECKVKVRSGQFDQGMVLDMALSQEERRQGFGLMCMAKPISEELVIEWGTADAKPKLFPPRENALYVVIDKRLLTARIVEMRLRPVGQAIRFWPGQYIQLGRHSPQAQENIPYRSYSIANSPRPDGEMVLHISRADHGKTSLWAHEKLEVGSTVKIHGAYGTFIGDPSAATPVLCLAAGTGLAPILSLTEAALRRGYRQKVMIVFSARKLADVYCSGMFAWWRTKHRHFDFKITLTREQQAGYLNGRIPDILPSIFTDLSQHSIFIAGGVGFVEDCQKAVTELKGGIIHTEKYTPTP